MAASLFLQRLGGSFGLRSSSLTNDLRAPIEVQWGNQAWQVVYPGRASTPALAKPSEVQVRLREAHEVAGTYSVVPGVALRVSRDLSQFNNAAEAWIEKDRHAVQHERDRNRTRRQMNCMEIALDAASDCSDDFNHDLREDAGGWFKRLCDCWKNVTEVCRREMFMLCQRGACQRVMLCCLLWTMLTLALICAWTTPQDAGGAVGLSFAVLELLLGAEFCRWRWVCLFLEEDGTLPWFIRLVVPTLVLVTPRIAMKHHSVSFWTMFIYIPLYAVLSASVFILMVYEVFCSHRDGPASAELNSLGDEHLSAFRRGEMHRQQRAKLLTFEGSVLAGKGLPCVCSWPGKYEGAWEALVQSSRDGETSAAVVFLPKDSERFGKHDAIPASENLEGACWCTPLYGEPKEWGCHWWTCWIANIEVAVQEGSRLQVFFFEGSLHKGKVESFATAGREHMERLRILRKKEKFLESTVFRDSVAAGLFQLSTSLREDGSSQYSRELHRLFLAWLPHNERNFLEASEGLGNSQKAEVAWLEKKGYEYEAVDVAKWMLSKSTDLAAPAGAVKIGSVLI